MAGQMAAKRTRYSLIREKRLDKRGGAEGARYFHHGADRKKRVNQCGSVEYKN
jgi:hypothetical protein